MKDNTGANTGNVVTLPPDNTGAVGTATQLNAVACSRECRTPATCDWPDCACPAVVDAARAA